VLPKRSLPAGLKDWYSQLDSGSALEMERSFSHEVPVAGTAPLIGGLGFS
jgi:hypothetical protein